MALGLLATMVSLLHLQPEECGIKLQQSKKECLKYNFVHTEDILLFSAFWSSVRKLLSTPPKICFKNILAIQAYEWQGAGKTFETLCNLPQLLSAAAHSSNWKILCLLLWTDYTQGQGFCTINAMSSWSNVLWDKLEIDSYCTGLYIF